MDASSSGPIASSSPLVRAKARASERAHKGAMRDQLAALRRRLRAALADKRARVRELVRVCRTERRELRSALREKRARALEQLKHDIRATRAAARLACTARVAEARKAADSEIVAARAALRLEREHQVEQRRIGREHVRRRAEVHRLHEIAMQSAAIESALLGRFARLFESIAPKVQPVKGESRGEALLRYVQTHPEEAHRAMEPHVERAIQQTRKDIEDTRRAVRSGGLSGTIAGKPRSAKAPSGLAPSIPKATPSRPTTKTGPAASGPRGGGVLLEDLLRGRRGRKVEKVPKPATSPTPPPKRGKRRGPAAAKRAAAAKTTAPAASTAQAAPMPAPVSVSVQRETVSPAPPPVRPTAKRTRDTVKAPEVQDTAEIAKLIREDIKAAVRAKKLPDANYSVTTEKYSMGSSINVVVSKLPIPVLNEAAFHVPKGMSYADFDREHFRSRFTPQAEAIQVQLEQIVGAYHWDRSDPAFDYYNQRFHYTIRLDDRVDRKRIDEKKVAQAKAEAKGVSPLAASHAPKTPAAVSVAARAPAALPSTAAAKAPAAQPAPAAPAAKGETKSWRVTADDGALYTRGHKPNRVPNKIVETFATRQQAEKRAKEWREAYPPRVGGSPALVTLDSALAGGGSVNVRAWVSRPTADRRDFQWEAR